jgi:signal transduction histidine kinase
MTAGGDLHQMASLGRLIAGIVHEINTPIASIFSNTEVILHSLEKLTPLLDGPSPDPHSLEKARKLVGSVESLVAIDRLACERIRSVIRALKMFSRVDNPEPQTVYLNQHLRDTLKLAGIEFGRRIAAETDLGELPEVECYPQLLNQVFLNILVNAAQAIEGPGKITVKTRLEDDMAHVSIRDTGSGIPPDQQAKIFQPGFTTKPRGEGTGLGLALCKEIIEKRHGGSISFDSEPGQGATFHVQIPIRQARSSAP